MSFKEFFSNAFFTFLIAFSAFILVLIYLKMIQYRLIQVFKKRRMENQIKNLKDHFIICGFGRIGTQVAEEFHHENVPFIVTDRDPLKIKQCLEKGWLCILGDAAVGDETLKKAMIEKAKGIVIAIGQDADAVFTAVAAKSLNPNAFIVARASGPETASKLEKVGAERVALPYQIGGYHMANMALRPEVVDFLDVIVDSKHQELVVDEISIAPASRLAGKALGQYFDRKKSNVVVLAIKKADQSCIVNPTPDITLKSHDGLIVLGTKSDIEEIKKLL